MGQKASVHGHSEAFLSPLSTTPHSNKAHNGVKTFPASSEHHGIVKKKSNVQRSVAALHRRFWRKEIFVPNTDPIISTLDNLVIRLKNQPDEQKDKENK